MALRVDEEQTVAVFLISGRKGSCMPRLLLGAAALALVLAGCGGDPESTPSPEVTLTTPVDASPSASPAPTLPAAAQANTKAGAIAFVKHYVGVQNSASSSGKTDELKSLTLGSCEECAAIAQLIDRIHASAGRIEGEGWHVLSAAPASVNNPADDMTYIDVGLRVSQQTILESPGATPSTFAGNPRRPMTFALVRSDNGWKVARIIASKS